MANYGNDDEKGQIGMEKHSCGQRFPKHSLSAGISLLILLYKLIHFVAEKRLILDVRIMPTDRRNGQALVLQRYGSFRADVAL